jgi:hypothetical protein
MAGMAMKYTRRLAWCKKSWDKNPLCRANIPRKIIINIGMMVEMMFTNNPAC